MGPVRLRALRMTDLGMINIFHNDEEINALTGGRKRFVSAEYDEQWLKDKMLNNENQVYCGIAIDSLIGYTSLNNIDLVNRHADWGGIIIQQAMRGKGYGTQAALQMLKYGFHELGLEKISGQWLMQNMVSITMAKMIGFVQEGILRRDRFKNNQWYDMLIMSLLKEEFEIKYKEYYL